MGNPSQALPRTAVPSEPPPLASTKLPPALADKEKVEITDADVDTHLADLAKERDKSVARLKAEMQREDPNLQQLRGQLRLEMALDVLEAKAQIKKADAASDAAAAT